MPYLVLHMKIIVRECRNKFPVTWPERGGGGWCF